MSLEGVLTTKLLLHECHFTWSLREEDFVLSDLLNRLEEQIELESDEQRVTRAYSSLGFVQFLYGNQQEALSNLQKSVQLANEYYKDSDEVLIVTYGDLAWLHYHMNEFSKCEDYLRELERIRRKFSEGFTYSVEVLREKGWTFLKFSYKYYNAAKECFRQALDMNPDDSDLNSGYAIVLYRTTKNTADSSDSPTTKQLEKAIKLDPDDAALLVLLALRMQHNRDDLKNAQLKRSVLEWLLEKCGHKSYICGSAPETTERIELSERIQMMIRKNNSMHLVLPNISDGDSQSSSDILRKLDVKDHLFTPEVTIQDGQSKYRLQCSHAGWYHCDFTQIGFYMEKEGEVLYRTVLQDSDCPFPANYYQAGPVYDIKCVQGELSQLRLPHCETSIEDACHFMSVIHYSSQIVDILKPHNITSTHVTLSITGTSKFVLSKKFNFFKDHWSRILGQVMLFYIERTHRLHVFLEACNVDPREVKKDRKEYTLIQTSCQCILKNKCQYSMSCDSVEKHECSERLLSEIEPADTTLQLSDQWKHHFPTFDIKLPDDVMKVNLQLKKKNLKKGAFEAVWSRNITLTDYTAENRRSNLSTEEQCVSFLNNHRPELIQREQIQLECKEARVTRAYSSLGFIQYLYGNQQEALANLQKSVEIAKEHYKDNDEVLIVTYGDLAWLHYHMNAFSKCEDYLRELERIHKNSDGFGYTVEVLREKGWTFLKFSYKYSHAAKACFRQALEINPDDGDLNAGYAIALYRTTKNIPDSSDSPTIKQLERAIELNKDDAVLLLLLALMLQHNKDDRTISETAQKKVTMALKMSPENPHVIRYTAKFFRQLGNMDIAINLLEDALQATPNSAFIHHQLALCYKNKKTFLERKHRMYGKAKFNVQESDEIHQYLDQCIYHLDRALFLKPSFVIATADLALHYGQLGSFKAESLFGEAFKMANNEKNYLQAVHCIYGQYQLYYQRSEPLAFHHFMQGLRLQPETELGMVCEKKLKIMMQYRIKWQNILDDGVVCGIQGFIHEVKGEKLKAEELYERALKNGLEFGK
ncbi:hypothetical protein Q8A67_003727 [Cirrhinus molitorella]|uniref:FIIND domain-containing protein n=1 Tax=Cirrhinus molitorella TaxID=172907 RepID=A0AA88TUR8_9TELE|nr:hypothetical protein Q8A67_003727 [Cirrhinus molitorella]